MARGGINRVLVQNAYTALLQQGRKPSIDAVRIELGNTGSKTTIARYLKELQLAPSAATLTPQERLSAPLLALVNSLVELLAEEAEVTVTRVREQFDEERSALRATLSRIASEREQAQAQVTALTLELKQAQAQVHTARTQLEDEQRRAATLQANVQELVTQLAEKHTQLQTLAEASAHARESLMYFREAAKEQRDALLNQHEQRVQQVQQQLRDLARTLDAKQEAVIGLNRDNERLTGELATTRKQAQTWERQGAAVARQLSDLTTEQDQLKAQVISLSLQLDHAAAQTERLQQVHTATLQVNARLQQRLSDLTPMQP
ncbi:hypothetical protein BLL42_22255 [Pseudomonas frederiksbergensis]|uniref:KfrA N-terminal DNA-binding domain-containing protein n=1 Tax=Pseudomonas frederiksbergensis TaxID=104087 RepID=A0A1J0EQU8_9PSED|nr:DNA-binding protein [Pseudomonas frederiksbergensis]APC18311.1 hypothetical protein BLL42_22255 [Pseudomonas frederiksbergensis]